MENISEELNISKEYIFFNQPMKDYTSFKVGGNAQCLIKIKNEEDLIKVVNYTKAKSIPLTIIGNGSNLLVLDGGIKGIVAKIEIEDLLIEEQDKDVIVKVGAGYKLSMLSQILLKKEITGFEELSGIPGTIGGAIRMNAGAYGKEFKDIVDKVICIDYNGQKVEFGNSQMKFEYRNSMLKNNKYIVLYAKLYLKKGQKEKIKEKMVEYGKSRKEKQPLEYPSAGSTFKRGNDFITAKIIDEAGLKGYTIGGAMVSTKHSGFIINKGNATAKDIVDLIDYIKKEIKKKFNKKIELEIDIIGEKL